MPSIVTTYPGVYIQELFNLQLSVQNGATAVPIFADNPANSPLTQAVRINSWLDFVSQDLVGEYNPRYHMHRTLKAYFENGGGPCYLVKADKMLEEVPKYDDITLLVSAGWDIATAVNTLCVDGSGLFAILDGPRAALTSTPGAAAADPDPADRHNAAWKENPSEGITDNAHVAVYYPWLTRSFVYMDEPADADEPVTGPLDVPPSAVLAGIYCANDRARGVWKAPANVTVKGGYALKHGVTDTLQGEHNSGPATYNMLRDFRNSGVTVWGARTRKDDDNWRYVPVRRLFDAAERDIKRAMQAVMFEPNTAYTWTRVRAAIEAYLYAIWQQGGLQGDKPSDAFFVQVGLGLTMTQAEIDQGQMIVKIGLRPARPVEFIILQFTQEMIAN